MKVRQCTSFFNIMTICMPNLKIDIDITVCTNQNMFDSTAKRLHMNLIDLSYKFYITLLSIVIYLLH